MEYKIKNEDCVVGMFTVPDNHVDLTVTSPPYDDMRTYDGKSNFDFEAVARGLYRITKPGGVVVWVVGDQTKDGDESGTSFRQALFFKEIGFNLWDTMIYSKTPRAGVGNNRGYWQAFEYMFVFSTGVPKTINLIEDRRNVQSGKKRNGNRGQDGHISMGRIYENNEYGRRTNVWEYSIGKGHSVTDKIAHKHPAIFPEALARDHILSWSNEGDMVFDPFTGSGTTAVMAIKHDRNFLGFEINPDYVAITNERIENSQRQLTLF